jgi:hypothetical protein
MGDLVAYLLAHRQRIPNRAIIACLALAQLAPKPTERFIAECGGPCEQDFRLCDCGLLQQLNPRP